MSLLDVISYSGTVRRRHLLYSGTVRRRHLLTEVASRRYAAARNLGQQVTYARTVARCARQMQNLSWLCDS